MKKLYERLALMLPWAVMLGIFQISFQKFLPAQRLFKGVYFFDYFTITDVYVSVFLAVFVAGFALKKIHLHQRKVPFELLISAFLLIFSGILQFLFQKTYEPVLSTSTEYFRGMILYPLLVTFIFVRTLDDRTVERLLKSYLFMVILFCLLALLQFFTGIFPGAAKDFTGRLTWPYIDFLSLKSGSANWAAFFVTPTVSLCLTKLLQKYAWKLPMKKSALLFYAFGFAVSSLVLLLTQSYSALAAVILVTLFYSFRVLSLKKFIVLLGVLLVLGLVGIGALANTKKFQILTGQQQFKFDNSASSRVDIYSMNVAMIKQHPLLGVGLNQYQSFFTANQERILGHKLNESHVPPHAHNFFMSFWTNLGIFGVLAMVILIFGIFWRTQFSAEYPAVFVLLAVMIHGLLDSYYWQQDTAYNFWFVIAFCYIFHTSKRKHEEKEEA